MNYQPTVCLIIYVRYDNALMTFDLCPPSGPTQVKLQAYIRDISVDDKKMVSSYPFFMLITNDQL